MEQFDSDWLALREPLDARARSRFLARAFLRSVRRGGRIADLGAGRGAKAVYLAALGRPDLRWRLIDGDRGLLAEARRRGPRAETVCRDLSTRRIFPLLRDCDGVCASALCDLVSAAWIEALVSEAARHRLPLLISLTVDGRITLSPAHALDEAVLGAFRRDQRRSKGFGPALGPAAPPALIRTLRRHGYRVQAARSDWILGPGDRPMLRAVIGGIVGVEPDAGRQWRETREAQIAAKRLAVRVGHLDILALPWRSGR